MPYDEDHESDAMGDFVESTNSQCSMCGQDFCKHGNCECPPNDEYGCRECYRQKQLELDAELEASFQHNVAGPLLGFQEHYAVDNGYCSCGVLCETGTRFQRHLKDVANQ